MPLDSAGDFDESEERLLADQLRPALTAALAHLSDEQRSAVELRVVHDLDYPDVAFRLGCTEGTARMRVFRGLRQLNAALTTTRLETP